MQATARRSFGPHATSDPVVLGSSNSSVVTLENGPVRVRLLGYGATVASVECPDREGRRENVVLGFSDPGRYLGEHPYFGSTVGRFANRIRGAAFSLDGSDVRLVPNENGHQLHGGPDGFHRAFFDAELLRGADHAGVAFSRSSPHGEGGFPGNLDVRVEYRLFEHGALRIDFFADTDRPTIVNLTHHGYWSLGGPSCDVRDEILWIAADRYVPLDSQGIPTGGSRPVDGTPFDFREPRRIGEAIGEPEVAMRHGYDHPFVVGSARGSLARVATLRDPASGRRLDVFSTEPVLHLYTGQLLVPQEVGHPPFSALCLETGQAPDCPNQPELGSARLMPGERYEHTVIYKLGADA